MKMPRKKTIYYIGLDGAYCGLTTDSKRETLRRLGTENVATFRPATAEDIASVKAMGGFVPDGAIRA